MKIFVNSMYRLITCTDSNGDVLTGGGTSQSIWPEIVAARCRLAEFVAIVIVGSVAGNVFSSVLREEHLGGVDVFHLIGCVALAWGAYHLYRAASLTGSHNSILSSNLSGYVDFLDISGVVIRRNLKLALVLLLLGTLAVMLPTIGALCWDSVKKSLLG